MSPSLPPLQPIVQFLFKIALHPVGIYKKLGIDIYQLQNILYYKLTMDDRRQNTFTRMRQNEEKKEVSSSIFWGMLWSAIIGIVFGCILLLGKNSILVFTLYYSIIFTMLAMILISDFTEIIFSFKDNFIILPKPVNDITVLTARFLHIFVYLGRIVFPLFIPGMIIVLIKYGFWASLVFLCIAMALILFVLFFVNSVYILILRVTSASKFQNVIANFQIIFSIVIYASYQLLPRLVGQKLITFQIEDYNWRIFLPFYWFSKSWQGLTYFNFSNIALLCILFTFLTPFLLLYVINKYLAPRFISQLSNAHSAVAEDITSAQKTDTFSLALYSQFLATISTRTTLEKTGFLFTWKLMTRLRDYKMKVYPALGYMVVVALMFVVKDIKSMKGFLWPMEYSSQPLILFIYFFSLSMISFVSMLPFTEKWRGSWMYFTSPIHKPSHFIKGAYKSTILFLLFPLCLICFIPIGFSGIKIIPNILLALSNVIIILMIIILSNTPKFPFSQPMTDSQNEANNSVVVIIITIATLLIAFVHAHFFKNNLVIYVSLLVSFSLNWIFINTLQKKIFVPTPLKEIQ